MLGFLAASLLLVMLPGPDQALITRNALRAGRRAGLATMTGGAAGLMVHSLAAGIGLSAFFSASANAYTALKVVGVAYLIFLGLKTIGSAGTATVEHARAARGATIKRSARDGALSNLLNPKVAVFFITFLPQFTSATAPAPARLGPGLIFAVVYVAWFSVYVALVDRIGEWLRRATVQRRVERATGGALVAFAVRLAIERRPA